MDEDIEKAIRAVMPNTQPASEPRQLAPYLLSAPAISDPLMIA